MVEMRNGELNVKTVSLIAKIKGSNPVLAFFTTAKETAMIFFTFKFLYTELNKKYLKRKEAQKQKTVKSSHLMSHIRNSLVEILYWFSHIHHNCPVFLG